MKRDCGNTADCNLQDCDVHPHFLEETMKKISTKKTCSCDWCKEYGRWKKVLAKTKPLSKKDKKFLNDTYEHYLDVDNDHDHLKAIMDGSWPSSRNYLESALKRVEEREAREIAETGQTSTPFNALPDYLKKELGQKRQSEQAVVSKDIYDHLTDGLKWFFGGICSLVYRFAVASLYVASMPLWILETSFKPGIKDTDLRMHKWLKSLEKKLEK